MRALALFVLLTAAVATGGAPAAARGHGSFPCAYKWGLDAGLRDGYVTAVNSARCFGRSGSLTLSARLLRLNPKTGKWRIEKTQTQTWRDLSKNRYVGVAEKCRGGTVRAIFGWILRDAGGSVVARNSVTTPRYRDPGAGCRIGIR